MPKPVLTPLSGGTILALSLGGCNKYKQIPITHLDILLGAKLLNLFKGVSEGQLGVHAVGPVLHVISPYIALLLLLCVIPPYTSLRLLGITPTATLSVRAPNTSSLSVTKKITNVKLHH
ncbi:hypothetical protein E2C01_014881 [Portunus trituberculatus]|uniref:Uncharacterized protein n=1 Tax=Portunus trituberculatus TaxID=210409 RepID=A0A5B7DKC3_PORTR|nr:hypothetical protein [Portunus trituberculatus]